MKKMNIKWIKSTCRLLVLVGACLVSVGAQAMERQKPSRSSFFEAIQKCDVKKVKKMIRDGAEVNAKNEAGLFPLYIAANHEKGLEVVKVLLVEGKADPNVALGWEFGKERAGHTALHAAVIVGNTLMAMWLICYGADWEVIDGSGKKVLEYASVQGSSIFSHWIPFLREFPFHVCAVIGCLPKVKFYVLAGMLRKKDNHGKLAIHWACREGQWEVAEFLLKKDPSLICEKCEFGWIPLHYACNRGRLRVVKGLTKKLSLVNSVSKSGFTPLHAAASGGCKDVVRFLLGKGADLSAVTNNGSTPLHLAAQNGHLDVMKNLVWYGGNLRKRCGKSYHERTSLEILLSKSKEKHVEFMKWYEKNKTKCHKLNLRYLSRQNEMLEPRKDIEERLEYLEENCGLMDVLMGDVD